MKDFIQYDCCAVKQCLGQSWFKQISISMAVDPANVYVDNEPGNGHKEHD